jgi:hypothetical protein
MIVVLRPILPEPSQPFSSTATLRMPVLLGEIIGGGKPVAGADDDDVIGRLRIGLAPGRRPVLVPGDGVPEERYEGIAHGG